MRSIVKHNASLARSVVEMGGLDLILGCMEEFDAAVKEAAAFVLGYIARQDLTLALAVVGSGKFINILLPRSTSSTAATMLFVSFRHAFSISSPFPSK